MYCLKCGCDFVGLSGKCPTDGMSLVETPVSNEKVASKSIPYSTIVDLITENNGKIISRANYLECTCILDISTQDLHGNFLRFSYLFCIATHGILPICVENSPVPFPPSSGGMRRALGWGYPGDEGCS